MQYQSVSDFRNGKADVEKDGKYFYIDTRGQILREITTYDYDFIAIFYDGLAMVKKDDK